MCNCEVRRIFLKLFLTFLDIASYISLFFHNHQFPSEDLQIGQIDNSIKFHLRTVLRMFLHLAFNEFCGDCVTEAIKKTVYFSVLNGLV